MLRPIAFLASDLGQTWHQSWKKVGQRCVRFCGEIFYAAEGEKLMESDPILRINRYTGYRTVAIVRQKGSEAHFSTPRVAVGSKIDGSILPAAQFFGSLPYFRKLVARDDQLDPNTARHKETDRRPTTKSGRGRWKDRTQRCGQS